MRHCLLLLGRSSARAAAATLALIFVLTAAIAQPTGALGPPPAVTVMAVQSRAISRSSEFIGRIEAIHAVDLRARVDGFLQQVPFHEGQDVHTGDLLYVIEPDPYQAALAAAQAQLARSQATLREAERNLARNQELARHGNVSQATLDQAIAQRDTAAADVAAAQASVKTAQLNLGYTRIASPIDGRIGATAITAGNLVGPNSGMLARVVELDPIRAVFSVSERDLLAVKQNMGNAPQQEINARFVPTLRLSDGSTYPDAGRVDFVDNIVDPTTGTVAVHAVVANANKLLLPGMLVTVLVRPQQAERAITVPVTALQQDQQGKYVLVVDNNNRVVQRRVEVNGQVDQQWVVTSGLREGEEIVVEGLQKVRPGQMVNPVPQGKPASQ